MVEDYDATCDAPEDCVAVVDQGFCGDCDSWASLAEESAAEFEDDQDRYGDQKHCRYTILIGCGELGEAPAATCDANVCTTQ